MTFSLKRSDEVEVRLEADGRDWLLDVSSWDDEVEEGFGLSFFEILRAILSLAKDVLFASSDPFKGCDEFFSSLGAAECEGGLGASSS